MKKSTSAAITLALAVALSALGCASSGPGNCVGEKFLCESPEVKYCGPDLEQTPVGGGLCCCAEVADEP